MKHDYTDEEIQTAWKDALSSREFLDALPERPQAQPSPWPGQQEAIDAAFQQIDEFYLDYKSSHDDWEHEAPARLAIAQAYDAARPQAAEIAALKAEREKWEADALRYCKNADFWRSEHDKAQPEPAQPWTPAVGDTVRSIPEMALGGQMYWRDLALQIARVWWKCHNIGASLQHGDLNKDIAFSIVCERHGGRVFHGDTPENAWNKAEEWLLSPDRENFPAACLTPARP